MPPEEQLPGEPRQEPGGDQELTETAPTAHKPEGVEAREDVVSDPALDDRLGSDWQDEGGATTEGPATAPVQQDEGRGGSLPAITLDPPD